MKNILSIAIALSIVTSLSTQLIYSKRMQAPAASEEQITESNEQSKIKRKTKKPEYYQGHSFGLQNYPGKTIDAGANTGMLPTNSSSPLMGNDITF